MKFRDLYEKLVDLGFSLQEVRGCEKILKATKKIIDNDEVSVSKSNLPIINCKEVKKEKPSKKRKFETTYLGFNKRERGVLYFLLSKQVGSEEASKRINEMEKYLREMINKRKEEGKTDMELNDIFKEEFAKLRSGVEE